MGKFITDLSSVTTVGLDLAKHVFQVHGVDASGRVIVAKAFRRKDVLAFFAPLPECPRCSGSKAGKKNAKIFWKVVLDVYSHRRAIVRQTVETRKQNKGLVQSNGS